MKRLTFNVSFRLDERLGKMLKDRAETGGTTPNDVARKIVEEKLNRNDEALLDGLNFLGQMVCTGRKHRVAIWRISRFFRTFDENVNNRTELRL